MLEKENLDTQILINGVRINFFIYQTHVFPL